MEIVICRDAVEAGKLGAATIAELVRNKPDAVLGLATGSSPWPSTTSWRGSTKRARCRSPRRRDSASTSTWAWPPTTPRPTTT